MNNIVTIITTIASNPGVFLTGLAITSAITYIIWHMTLTHNLKKHKHTVKVNTINTQVQQNAVNPSTNLPEKLDKALDLYDSLGIRIPADIIEDLSTQQFNNIDHAINRIEIHRNNWKVENSKKFKKDVA